jgi:hypothetical protein
MRLFWNIRKYLLKDMFFFAITQQPKMGQSLIFEASQLH